ncbi:SGNH/GDSL hydrolase family protein [Virgibacillus byunsanensis]|uniref:SGNH/GDSL hydrolase family protein n=1 Tax=Virgibacillus byunsanensis TaxID=570945 RepID=A0ABW3LHR2_9BACI
MNKRRLVLAVILLLLGAGIFFIVDIWNEKDQVTIDNPSLQQESEEETHTTEDEDTEEQKIEEDTDNSPLTTQFKDVITEAVQGTIDFFTNKETRVVAIGDSLTQGVGDETGEGGYIGILDNTINKNKQLVRFDNFGKRGNRSDQLLKRIEDPEISTSIAEADIVLLTVGANDIMKVVKENFTNLSFQDFVQERIAYEERLEEIISTVESINGNADVYLLGFYNPFEQYFDDIEELGIIVEDWNRTGEAVASNHENLTFIPTVDLFTNTDENVFAEDKFHPNYNGYQRIAKRVLEYVTQ